MPGDSDYVLLFKICQRINSQNSGNLPPEVRDTRNDLLRKIAQLLNGE